MKDFKKLLFMIVALAISVASCSDDDDDDNDHDYRLEHVNVTSAEVPDQFTFGSTYQIEVTIELPSSCYSYYNRYDYVYEGTARLIYPIAHVDEGVACNPSITETVFSIPVTVLQSETYVFKFYQGKDADGTDKFLTIEVPVNNSNEKNSDTNDTEFEYK